MTQGVSGYFDIAGSRNFTGRFFYSEQYDKTTGKRVAGITGISMQNTVYGGTWYLGGTVAVDGETLQTMTYEGKVTHSVSVAANSTWYAVKAVDTWGLYFPWESGEIASNQDGSKSVTFDVDITLWRSTDGITATIKGSYTVELTKLSFGPMPRLRRNGAWVQPSPYLRQGGAWVQPRPGIK